MKKHVLFLLTVAPLFNACAQQDSRQPNYFDLVVGELTGDIAYNTTAFVEKYWRVVGNAGFDSSIYYVVRHLEDAGYVLEEKATKDDQLTYRIEKRPMERPTWEPGNETVKIVGETEPLLESSTNRNMIAINSYSTPEGGVEGEVVYVEDIEALRKMDVKGKIVYAKANLYQIYKVAVQEGGALGVVIYNNPEYLQPAKNTTSIQFRSIPLDQENKSWGIALSYGAMQRLDKKLQEGPVRLHVAIHTRIYPSEELTVVANVKGTEKPKERLVFSAHVQEPGANDNASGVGANLEMATVTAKLVKEGKLMPRRTITFLWGDEIVSTNRYVQEDRERAKDIKWGISLDMVGENTALTGGTFLIEKMPDPSAIWTRGKDEHTEWGASEMTLEDMKPHYLNDFVIHRMKEQGRRANWVVKANPFEGGSDHVPFLRANIPGVLFWHFTDQFYHTDNDRIDKVSKVTLKNVMTGALVSAYTLVNADASTAKAMIDEVQTAGVARLKEELRQGKLAIAKGASKASQVEIIDAWEDWYLKALASCADMVDDTATVQKDIEKAQAFIKTTASGCQKSLD